MDRREFVGAAGAVLLVRRLPTGTGENLDSFVSRPDLKPPRLTVLQRHTGTAPGLVFLAPSSGPGQRGAMIVDGAGELVWFRPVPHKAVTDFKLQRFRGAPVLTWWEGKATSGIGDGEWVVLDATYRELARFSAARGLPGDLHEFQITAQNTALVTANEIRPWRGGHVVGGVVQELALPSGQLLWEWRSLDHVAVAETEIKAKPGPRFDYFHVNSIDVAPDGNLIVSGRNTWAAYKVERHNGRVLWRLGGKHSDFALGHGANFEWQHDVREHPGGLLTVFDNAAAPAKEPRSRALVLSLDEKRKRVELVHAYAHSPALVLSHFLGNTQLLDDGNVFVGWGGSPYVTEFARNGTIVFDARVPPGGQSYRAFRFPWTGRPADKPAVAARGGAVYASWNGATDVASWQLLEDGNQAGTVPRNGFETKLAPSAHARTVAVAALDASGRPLGTSASISV